MFIILWVNSSSTYWPFDWRILRGSLSDKRKSSQSWRASSERDLPFYVFCRRRSRQACGSKLLGHTAVVLASEVDDQRQTDSMSRCAKWSNAFGRGLHEAGLCGTHRDRHGSGRLITSDALTAGVTNSINHSSTFLPLVFRPMNALLSTMSISMRLLYEQQYVSM